MMIKIRPANLGDSQDITKVHFDSWRETYSGLIDDEILNALDSDKREKIWNQVIADSSYINLVALIDDQIVGFISAGPTKSLSNFCRIEVYAIYLLKKYHGLGIGYTLFKTLNQKLKLDKMGLRVLEKNPSRIFYERLGGLVVDARKDHEFRV